MAITNQTSGTSTNSMKKTGHPRGSGNDLNSDTRRLQDEDNLQDKTVEDSFPASDPPSNTPVSGVGAATRNSYSDEEIKNNPAAQFEYGRQTEAKTLHFEQNTNRLRQGNPDIGNVDLGNIEADKPAQKDDNDHYD